jgi:hypothetical protein
LREGLVFGGDSKRSPDVPITGVAVDLTTGPRSLLGANGVL